MDRATSLVGRVTLWYLESRDYPSIPETTLRCPSVRAVILRGDKWWLVVRSLVTSVRHVNSSSLESLFTMVIRFFFFVLAVGLNRFILVFACGPGVCKLRFVFLALQRSEFMISTFSFTLWNIFMGWNEWEPRNSFQCLLPVVAQVCLKIFDSVLRKHSIYDLV